MLHAAGIEAIPENDGGRGGVWLQKREQTK
jgi:hypothetical protein